MQTCSQTLRSMAVAAPRGKARLRQAFPGPHSIGVSVSLVGDGADTCQILAPGVDPCFTIQGSFIENLVGTAFTDDQLIGNELKNQITSGDGGSWDPIFTGQICAVEFLDGRESADTYKASWAARRKETG